MTTNFAIVRRAILATLLLGAALFLLQNEAAATHEPVEIAIDAEVSGNAANSLGTTEACNTSTELALGDQFSVDVVIRGVPVFRDLGDDFPLSVLKADGISGYGFDLFFDGSILKLVDVLGDRGPTLLAASGVSVPFTFMTPEDPADATNHVRFDYIDFLGQPEGGDGILTRIVFEVVGEGVSALELHNFNQVSSTDPPGIQVADYSGQIYEVSSQTDAKIATAGASCGDHARSILPRIYTSSISLAPGAIGTIEIWLDPGLEGITNYSFWLRPPVGDPFLPVSCTSWQGGTCHHSSYFEAYAPSPMTRPLRIGTVDVQAGQYGGTFPLFLYGGLAVPYSSLELGEVIVVAPTATPSPVPSNSPAPAAMSLVSPTPVGQWVTVYFTWKELPNLIGGAFEFIYDPAILQVISCEAIAGGACMADFTHQSVRFAAIIDPNTNPEGLIGSATFRARSEGTSSIFYGSYGEKSFDPLGQITIIPAAPRPGRGPTATPSPTPTPDPNATASPSPTPTATPRPTRAPAAR